MSRIAFFSIPAHGHTNPTVEVVRTLVARGHQVRYYSFEEFRGRLEGAGAEFVPCDSYLPPAPRDVERRIGRDFASLIGMVVDVTVAMEERVLGERAALVGPVLPELPAPAERGNRRLIYVSLGTVMNRNARFYRNCAEALGGGPWDVLMSVGSGEQAAALGALSPNVRAEARVDQLRVLQAAHLFVTHCGMNSVSESIWQGVPMVLSPQQSEERMVARRAAELGAGLLLKRSGPAAIRAAVEEVLSRRADYCRAIEPLAAGFRAAGGALRAAEHIEGVIARRSGVARPQLP